MRGWVSHALRSVRGDAGRHGRIVVGRTLRWWRRRRGRREMRTQRTRSRMRVAVVRAMARRGHSRRGQKRSRRRRIQHPGFAAAAEKKVSGRIGGFDLMIGRLSGRCFFHGEPCYQWDRGYGGYGKYLLLKKSCLPGNAFFVVSNGAKEGTILESERRQVKTASHSGQRTANVSRHKKQFLEMDQSRTQTVSEARTCDVAVVHHCH